MEKLFIQTLFEMYQDKLLIFVFNGYRVTHVLKFDGLLTLYNKKNQVESVFPQPENAIEYLFERFQGKKLFIMPIEPDEDNPDVVVVGCIPMDIPRKTTTDESIKKNNKGAKKQKTNRHKKRSNLRKNNQSQS